MLRRKVHKPLNKKQRRKLRKLNYPPYALSIRRQSGGAFMRNSKYRRDTTRARGFHTFNDFGLGGLFLDA